MSKALEHLRSVDPALGATIDELGPCLLRKRRVKDPYVALVRAIVGQRISTKAAQTVYGRLMKRLDDDLTPERLLRRRVATLRSVGLPLPKVEALRELSTRVRDGRLPLERMSRWSNERIEAALVEIHGVGPWTAQIYMLFCLARPDVFPAADLGLQMGLQRVHGLDERPTAREAARLAEPWAPYRSTASWYLWRVLDGPAGTPS